MSEIIVKIPEFWNKEIVLKVLQTYDSYDLPEYFMCSSPAFIKLMKNVLPDKPINISYAKYLKDFKFSETKKPVWDIKATQAAAEARRLEEEFN